MQKTQTVTYWQLPGMTLKKAASTNGGEYTSACPECGGNDRFHIWPNEGENGRFWCRQCSKKGDLIDFLRWQKRMTFQEACEAVGKTLNKKRRLKVDLSWREPRPVQKQNPTEKFPEGIQTQQVEEKIPKPLEETPPAFKLINPACMTCESNYKNWCTVHPRNQFVNIEFIERCPKNLWN